jgi:hypothetical protein
MSNTTTRTNIIAPPQQAIQAEIDQRIQTHQARIAATPMTIAGVAVTPLNLLGAGDSWFDYPIPGYSDVLAVLNEHATVLKLAHYGDATTDLLGVQKRARLVQALGDPRNGKFDAILFSGGGNDLVGNQFRLWLNDAPAGLDIQDAVDQSAFNDILGVVKTAYLDLIAARNSVPGAANIPILAHAYDFAIPTGTGVCTIGPWLLPSLQSRGWMKLPSGGDLTRGAAIVKEMLGQFHTILVDLAAVQANNMLVVNTQGTLLPTEWANELHPGVVGFRKIAACFTSTLKGLFGSRVPLPSPGLPPPAEFPAGM